MRVNRQSDPRWRWAGAAAAVVTLLSFAAASPGVPSGSLPASLLMPMSGFVPDEALAAYADPEHLAAVPAGPGRVAEPVAGVLAATRVVDTLGESGIPDVALRAYKQAAAQVSASDPSCGLSWTVLAAIGRVESDHGRFGGTSLRADGTGTMRIRGIPLDGRANVVLIRDTDRGALDGDTTYDRAVGPMQFIPSTWRLVMADGNGDGRNDVHNIFDAALGAARYLCTGTANLRNPGELSQAIRRYNNADSYVRVVLNLARRFASGSILTVPTDPTGRPASGDRRLALPWPTDRPADKRWTQPRPPAIPWRTPDDPTTDNRTEPAAPTRTAPPVQLVPATPTPPLTGTITPPPTTNPSTPPKPPKPTTTPPARPTPPPAPPTSRPTTVPTTSQPTVAPPTSQPTAGPSTSQPTSGPSTGHPTSGPSTSQPTGGPTTGQPTNGPSTGQPTAVPSTAEPTSPPSTGQPTAAPSIEPTTTSPTDQPTAGPATPIAPDSPEPSANEKPKNAAVGWAPAMRQQVVRILKSSAPKAKPSAPNAKASPPAKSSPPSDKSSPPSAKPSLPLTKPSLPSSEASVSSAQPSMPPTTPSTEPSARPTQSASSPTPSASSPTR